MTDLLLIMVFTFVERRPQVYFLARMYNVPTPVLLLLLCNGSQTCLQGFFMDKGEMALKKGLNAFHFISSLDPEWPYMCLVTISARVRLASGPIARPRRLTMIRFRPRSPLRGLF